jgi:hypothetical protein
MNSRLRLAVAFLAILVVANFAWRWWTQRGLITIDADKAPLSEVVRKIGKQGGIEFVTNASPETTITMHVRKVPLLRALEVLAINSGGSWTAAYLAAPDKKTIRGVLDDFEAGGQIAGWKKFFVPMPPMGGFGGAGDPREEMWQTSTVGEGTLQAYLQQGAQKVGAQFWAPEEWNPSIAKTPGASTPRKVVSELASAGGGKSEEVFLLNMPVRATGTAEGSQDGPPRGSDGSFARSGPPAGGPPRGGPPDEATRVAMEARARAQIDKLPADKKAAALDEFEKRKAFFESLAKLTPEERQAKIRERIEADMRGGPTKFETRMTQRDAMHTTEQRANFFRMVIKHKSEAAGQ